MKDKYSALIGGGIGPDVWEKDVLIVASDFMDAAQQAHDAAEQSGGYVICLDYGRREPAPAAAAPSSEGPSDAEMLDWLEGNTVELHCAGLYDGTNAAVIRGGDTRIGPTIRAAIRAAMQSTRQGDGV